MLQRRLAAESTTPWKGGTCGVLPLPRCGHRLTWARRHPQRVIQSVHCQVRLRHTLLQGFPPPPPPMQQRQQALHRPPRSRLATSRTLPLAKYGPCHRPGGRSQQHAGPTGQQRRHGSPAAAPPAAGRRTATPRPPCRRSTGSHRHDVASSMGPGTYCNPPSRCIQQQPHCRHGRSLRPHSTRPGRPPAGRTATVTTASAADLERVSGTCTRPGLAPGGNLPGVQGIQVRWRAACGGGPQRRCRRAAPAEGARGGAAGRR